MFNTFHSKEDFNFYDYKILIFQSIKNHDKYEFYLVFGLGISKFQGS